MPTITLTPKENLAYRTIKMASTDAAAAVNVTGGAVTIYSISMGNAANAAIHLCLEDSAFTGGAVGTTAPSFIMRVANGATKTVNIPGGLTFSTGLNMWTKAEAGTAGTTAPAGGTVTVYFTTSI